MKSKAFAKILILLVLVIIAGSIVWLYQRPVRLRNKIRNVILISMDTTRADFLSCYMSPSKTSPNIDDLAEEGILFENAITPIPFTLPAHCSMLTGTTPQYHGVLDNSFYRLSEKNVTLAEKLKKKGFTTAAFISTFILDSFFGVDQGFDVYNDNFQDERNPAGINERIGADTTALAIKWLEENKKKKNFVFVHYYDPHFTYEAPEPFASRFQFPETAIPKRFSDYAGEIAYTDHCIGELIQKLKELGLYDSALIVVTADHGESLGDHKEPTHGYYIYQSTVHVPLVFKIPGDLPKGMRIKNRVGIVDIVPTICSLLSVNIDEPIQGKDLTVYLNGEGQPYPDRHLDCLCLEPTKYKANSLLAVATNRYKYIQTTRPELYDLETDPYEKTNIIDLEPQRARMLQDRLAQILKETGTVNTRDKRKNKAEIDTETLKRLESLGYMGSAVDESFEFDQSKEDPKDVIDYHTLNSTIGYLIRTEDFDKAKANSLEMISMRPELPLGYSHMAKLSIELEEYDEATKYLEKSIELEPDNIYSYVNIANLLIYTKEFDRAIEYSLKVLEVKPDFVEAYYLLNAGYIEKERYDLVRKNLTDELKVNNAYRRAFTSIADKLLEKQQIRHAHEYYLIAIKLKPDSEYVLNTLAWLEAACAIEGIRNPKQAVKYARRACELSENKKPELLDTLALAYAARGKFKKSIETAQKAIKIANYEENAELAERIRSRLELYQAQKTYLDPDLN